MLKVINDGKAPERATRYSAGIDLFASEDVVIGAGETVIVGLGVCIDYEQILDGINSVYPYNEGMLPENKFDHFKKTHYLELHPRSSLRAKGLISGVGIIDLDYEDEIKIIIHKPFTKNTIVRIINKLLNKFKLAAILNTPESWVEDNFVINKGDKVAQILLKEHKSYLLGVESNEERVGGFGSTGNK